MNNKPPFPPQPPYPPYPPDNMMNMQPPFPPQPPYPPYPMMNMQPLYSGGSGLAITSMVLGILSLVLYFFILLSLPCAITGIILASISLVKKRAGRGMAIAGLVCSIIAIAFIVFVFVFAAYLAALC